MACYKIIIIYIYIPVPKTCTCSITTGVCIRSNKKSLKFSRKPIKLTADAHVECVGDGVPIIIYGFRLAFIASSSTEFGIYLRSTHAHTVIYSTRVSRLF